MKWTDEIREREIRRVSAATGHLPSNQELQKLGMSGLANQISKYGGFLYWADRLGLNRKHSDSDTGWQGEIAFTAMCGRNGIKAERQAAVKSPFDIMLDGVLRVDVKSARYAEYGNCRGWFYRIGKMPQADIIVLYQLDTGNFYGLHWFICPTSNVTISRDGGKYAPHLNNWTLIQNMIRDRKAELQKIRELKAVA